MVHFVVSPMVLQTPSAPWVLSLAPPLGTLCSVQWLTEGVPPLYFSCISWTSVGEATLSSFKVEEEKEEGEGGGGREEKECKRSIFNINVSSELIWCLYFFTLC